MMSPCGAPTSHPSVDDESTDTAAQLPASATGTARRSAMRASGSGAIERMVRTPTNVRM